MLPLFIRSMPLPPPPDCLPGVDWERSDEG
jgi:hypothetical protein